MNKIDLKCIVSEGAEVPVYKTDGAAGADICAFLKSDVVILPGKFAMIPTGLYFEIPQGYEIQVRPRSGLAAKNGITVLNTPGTIDSDYRGELRVILINLGETDFVIKNKDRIAQIIIASVTQADFVISNELSKTERGEGGFGSTGV
ncbi:MAG: dUTP diphosphatase [Treponema sp.]|nr:dUTP diphosphatase [Treponema sp.]